MISETTIAYGSQVRRQGRSRPWAAYHARTLRRNVRNRLSDPEPSRGADPPHFFFWGIYSPSWRLSAAPPGPKDRSLIACGVDAKAAIRFFAGTPGGQFVALDQLMLEAAHVGVLGRELDHAVGRLGAPDALQGP